MRISVACLALLVLLLPTIAAGQNGSPAVPLDSWVYPAIDRLTSLGVVEAPFFGERPWTRRECAILARAARTSLERRTTYTDASARELIAALASEFAPDFESLDVNTNTLRFESAYARLMQISGTPLTDSYHFGQTIANDFGRPYGEGTQAIVGASFYGEHGRFFFYARGEYQHAPGFAGLTAAQTQALSTHDGVSPYTLNTQPYGTINRARLLDTYAGVRLGAWQATFGKQSLWWGTGNSGPMLFSNNVEPPTMFRLTNVDPLRLPFPFGFLGDTRFDFTYGKLYGHLSPRDPYFHGEKFSIKPTRNLEIDFSRTTIFLGEGRPLSWGRLWRSYFSLTSTSNSTATDPGDRKGGLTVSYHLPKSPVTVYFDSFTDDDPSPLSPANLIPLGALKRAPANPGIYIAQLPFARRLDLRAEGFYTDVWDAHSAGGYFVYFNNFYRDGYTMNGFMLGNTVGRQGHGAQVWSTYWFNPRSTLQFSYRGNRVNPDFIPNGGSQDTFTTRANLLLFKKVELSAQFQAERWDFPFLAPAPQHNVSGQLMLRIWGSDLNR